MSDTVATPVEQHSPPRSSTWQLARVISWIGHPLVFVSASFAIIVLCRFANRTGVSMLIALIVSVVLPTTLLLIRGVRSGHWSDADVSVQSERVHFYPRAILLSAVGVVTLFLLHAPSGIVRGALVTLALLMIAAVINRYLKISLHTMFAFYCAVILFGVGLLIGTIALVLAVLVSWSRLHLRRHALAEVLLGMFVGSAGAIVAGWWP